MGKQTKAVLGTHYFEMEPHLPIVLVSPLPQENVALALIHLESCATWSIERSPNETSNKNVIYGMHVTWSVQSTKRSHTLEKG
jgi:hypothetical protein